MTNQKHIWGAITVGIAAVLWGLDGIVLTPRLAGLDVGYVVFILHLIPFVIMNFFLYKSYRKIKDLTKQDFISFFLIALLGGALGTIAIVKALFLVNFQELSMVVLLQKMQPVFAVILAMIILKEKVRKQFFLWAGLAVTASYFLTFGFSIPVFNNETNTTKAALLSLFAAFAFGSSTVFSKKVLSKFSFQTSTFFRYGFTTIILLIYLLIFSGFGEIKQTSPTHWLIFFIIAFTTGSGAIFLYYWGLIRIRAVIATFAELMFPVSAIFFDYFINGNILSTTQWISATILIIAIVRISNLKAIKK